MAAPKLRFKEFDGNWNSVRLLDISTLVTKGTTPKQFINGDINFLKIEAITPSGFDLSRCQTINSEIHNKELKRSILKEGDILFAIAGATIGKNAIVQKELLPANTNQALAIIRLKENYSKVFISKVLNSPLMEKYIDINISTGAQPNLNLQQIGSFSFALPKLEEQIKIASFLSAVDEKISQLTQKHQLLSQYKQGMRQKLFSQQIRFKANDGSEFGEWEQVRLGNLVDLISGFAFKSDFFSEDGNKLITPKNFTTTGKANFTDTNTKWTTEISDKKYICRPNDLLVLLTDLTQSCELLGKPILLSQDDGNVLLNQRIVKIIPNRKLEKPFLLYLLLTDDFHELIVSTASGTTVKHSSNKVLQSFNFYLPCLEEQTKIANFLSAIDQKIEVVTQQIEQAKTWKKGLLQQMFV